MTAAFSKILAASMLYPATGDLPYRQNRDTDMILRGVHPDVREVEAEKSGIISVEAVRAMQREAHIKPNQAPGRVFILPGAAAMTPQAQNALLIITETPPAGVRFILTMENSHSLLPTVRSRLVVAALQSPDAPPPDSLPEASRAVAALLPDWQAVTEQLGQKAAAQLFADCAEGLEAIRDGNGYRLLALLGAREKKREEFIAFCRALRAVCAHHLVAAAVEALDAAATAASGNVFLPLLGCHTAARILP